MHTGVPHGRAGVPHGHSQTSACPLPDDVLPCATARSAPTLTFRALLRAAIARLDSGTSTRRPPGWMLNLSGVGRSSASPSTPANAEPEWDRTSKDSQVN